MTRAAVALALALLVWVWVPSVSLRSSWGWDEATNAALPAARMHEAARAGALHEAAAVLLDCQQYPPAFPILLAGVRAVAGADERAARRSARCVWIAGVLALYLLGREVSAELARRPGAPAPHADARIGLLAALLGALSPLALSYSGSLFLEVPSAVVATFALRAWLRRRAPDAPARRELAAGAWLTVALFTKWNYGLLLGLGLCADWLVEAALALRSRGFARFARSSLLLAVVPALACAWWFVLPWPAGAETAASHRAAVMGFLEGNRDRSMTTPYGPRILHWAASFAFSPRVLALELLGAAIAVAARPTGGVRTLALVLLAHVVPITAHNFHLDRFLIVCGPPLWALAAVGLARALPGRPLAATAGAALLLFASVVRPSADSEWLLARLGLASEQLSEREYQARTLAEWRDLSGDRTVPTAGIPRETHDALLDVLAGATRAAGADARVGWIGVNPEFPPAAIQLGLLDRGWSRARFRADAGRVRPEDGKPAMLITHEFVDPGWSSEQLHAWATRFDVLFTTRPMDWRGRGQEPLARYRDELLARGDWTHAALGRLDLPLPTRPPVSIEVIACRPRPR